MDQDSVNMLETLQELRHKETLACLSMIIGLLSSIGGFAITILCSNSMSWITLLPHAPPFILLSLGLAFVGFTLTSTGFLLTVHYDDEKMRLLRALRESSLHAYMLWIRY